MEICSISELSVRQTLIYSIDTYVPLVTAHERTETHVVDQPLSFIHATSPCDGCMRMLWLCEAVHVALTVFMKPSIKAIGILARGSFIVDRMSTTVLDDWSAYYYYN